MFSSISFYKYTKKNSLFSRICLVRKAFFSSFNCRHFETLFKLNKMHAFLKIISITNICLCIVFVSFVLYCDTLLYTVCHSTISQAKTLRSRLWKISAFYDMVPVQRHCINRTRHLGRHTDILIGLLRIVGILTCTLTSLLDTASIITPW